MEEIQNRFKESKLLVYAPETTLQGYKFVVLKRKQREMIYKICNIKTIIEP